MYDNKKRIETAVTSNCSMRFQSRMLQYIPVLKVYSSIIELFSQLAFCTKQNVKKLFCVIAEKAFKL